MSHELPAEPTADPQLNPAKQTAVGESRVPITKSVTTRVVVKSHIKTIGLSWGVLPPTIYDLIKRDPLGSEKRLAAFALATDAMMHEDPKDDRMDPSGATGEYRLFSATNVTSTYAGGLLVSMVASPLETDAGWEPPFHAPPLISIAPLIIDPAKGEFNWGVKGRPARVPALGMQAVFPRTNEFIWHQIRGRIDPAGMVAVSIDRSLFPSVTVFVDGVRKYTLAQGDASLLWIGGRLLL
jgi:hypothetical protein